MPYDDHRTVMPTAEMLASIERRDMANSSRATADSARATAETMAQLIRHAELQAEQHQHDREEDRRRWEESHRLAVAGTIAAIMAALISIAALVVAAV